MNSKGILNELRKEMDEIKQKPLNKPEVCSMSWNEKYQLNNTILCLQEENSKLKKVIEILKEKLDIKIEFYHNAGYMLNYKVTHNCMISHERCLHYLEVEEGGLLKELFAND